MRFRRNGMIVIRKVRIIIPMAGEGKRFEEFHLPKPMIATNLAGEMMWRTSAECLALPGCEFVFVIRKQVERKLRSILEKWNGGSQVVAIQRLTDGPLSTVLEAEAYIDSNVLIVANCDQFVDWTKMDLASFISMVDSNDGAIVTMNVEDSDKKWSYIKQHNGFISIVAEKVPISNEATLGIYGFKNGLEFVEYAKQMIASNIKVNGEFYVGPVYNQMIAKGKKIRTFNLTERNIKWCGLGTPNDLTKYRKGV